VAKSTPIQVELRTTDNEAMGLGSKPPLSQLQPVMMYTFFGCIFDAFATNPRPSREYAGLSCIATDESQLGRS
jgi:hypothetical protein